jgi:hypothetical protein
VAIKTEYAALGPNASSPTHTHVQPETRVDFLLFFIFFQTALLKEEGKAGLLILLVFMQSIKRSASKMLGYNMSFFLHTAPVSV